MGMIKNTTNKTAQMVKRIDLNLLLFSSLFFIAYINLKRFINIVVRGLFFSLRIYLNNKEFLYKINMKKDHLSFTLAISLGLVGVIGSYVGLRYVQYKNDEPFSVNSYESDANLDSGIEDLINSEEVNSEEPNRYHKQY